MALPPVPVNVKLQNPSTIDPSKWTKEVARWTHLNREAGGHPGFFPLTVKAAYVFGVVHDFCFSVEWLLTHPKAYPTTYLPAFGLCAASMELLGRCLRGNQTSRQNTADLKAGFEWLKDSSPARAGISPNALTATRHYHYDIQQLMDLRHFTLHGQATVNDNSAVMLDAELLEVFPLLIGNAMERYWDKLKNEIDFCENLARARILPLRSDPISKMWGFFERPGTSAGTPFYAFRWKV